MAKIHFSILLAAVFAAFLMAAVPASASHFSLTYGLTNQWIDIGSVNSSAIKAGYEVAVIVRGNITIGTYAAVGNGWYSVEVFGTDTEYPSSGYDGAHMNDTLEFRVWNGTTESTPISSPPSVNWTYPIGGDSPLATLFVDLYEQPAPYISIDSPYSGILYNSSTGFALNYTTNLNLSEAYYTIDGGVNHSFNDWFYQENASAWNCSGVWYNESYGWGASVSSMFDGDWENYAGSADGRCLVNYTLHEANVSAAKWMFRVGSSGEEECWGTGSHNASLPSACISSPLQLRFLSSRFPILTGQLWECWNGTAWYELFSCEFHPEAELVWEEALWERNMSPRSSEWLSLGNGSHTIQVCGSAGGVIACDSVNILVGSIAVGIDSPFEGVVYNSTSAFELNYTTNVNLTDAVYSVDGGANHSFAGWAYQENASARSCSGYWYYSSERLFDGDWNTESGSENGRCLVNYTFLAQSVSEVNWMFKVGSPDEDDCWGVHNASIPFACISSPLQLRFLSARFPIMTELWECWNGTAWYEVFSCEFHPEAELVWEEAIWENDTSPRSSEMLALENGTHTIQVCGSAGGITVCDSVNMLVGSLAVEIGSPYAGFIYNNLTGFVLNYTSNMNLSGAIYSIDGGANHSFTGWSYQENPSVWSCDDGWIHPASRLFDGDWNTYSSGGEGHCSLNYTLRSQNVSEVIWQFKIGSDADGCGGTYNNTIPPMCVSSPLQLRFNASNIPPTDILGTQWDCWNGTSWVWVFGCSMLSVEDNHVWEEAIWENDTSPRSSEWIYLVNGSHTIQVCGSVGSVMACDSVNVLVDSMSIDILSPYEGFLYNASLAIELNYTSNVNLFDAYYNIDGGANLSLNDWIYQENPSVWSCDDGWIHPASRLFDGDWNTYSSGGEGHCSLNYTLRSQNVSEVIWQFKIGSDADGCGGTYNNTIPPMCVSSPLQLRFNASNIPPTDILGTQWDCWNGTSWVWVFGCSMLSVEDNHVWEEALWEKNMSPRNRELLYLVNGNYTIQVCGSAGGVIACDSVNVTVGFTEEEEAPPPEGGETNIYGMLADSGSGLGGFLTAVNEPLVSVVLALGMIGGILTVIFGIVAAIASAFSGIGRET
jgi:disulfide bond formation protein DsbB